MKIRFKGKNLLIWAFLLFLSILPAPAPALAAAKKTVAAQAFSSKVKAIEKKALTVQRGTSRLLIKKNSGFLKFQAPKAKRYTFTFSDLKGKEGPAAYVTGTIPLSADSLMTCYAQMTTKGGISETLWLCRAGEDFSDYEELLGRPLPVRSGKIRLKKGAVLYLFIQGSGRFTINLEIR